MKNKILIYDDYCPLCSWYSGLFIKYGFLESNGRKPYSTLDDSLLAKIDSGKSRNEIPLLDTTSGKVLYGIDALLEILDTKIPCIKRTGNVPVIKWFLKKIYKLVSYNRKVIVVKQCGTGQIDCAPDMNYTYRSVWMSLGLLINTLLLFPLHEYLLSPLSFYHLSFWQLQSGHLALVAVNCILALSFSRNKGFEYLGQINMLALTVTVLLLNLMILQMLYHSEILTGVGLVAVTVFIFKEYIRRMEFAGILLQNKWVVCINLLCMIGFILFLFK
jgi:predicted DCC family thiol-disulfide oxidoreductase YuxK